MAFVVNNSGLWEGKIAAGLRLAELSEEEGGWSEYFDEDLGLWVEDDTLRAHTALVLENAKRWMATKCKGRIDESGRMHINEATRSALVGGFSDYIFPVIRAAFPTNAVNDLVSTQPTTRKTAQIIHWNWVVGGYDKGSYHQGMRIFDAQTGKHDAGYHFSDGYIDTEPTPVLGSAGATTGGTLAWHDGGGVIPGRVRISVEITTGPAVVELYDDADGNLVDPASTVTITASSINYKTGVWSVTISGETFTTSAGTATYQFDMEGSARRPQMDVQIDTSIVSTMLRSILVNYSWEAMQDVMAELGVSLEPALVTGAAEQMNDEIALQIVAELWSAAVVAASFPKAGPSEYNQQDHFKDLIYQLNVASSYIETTTQKAYGNWIVVDDQAATVIESLPAGMFIAAPRPTNPQGLHFLGTLSGKWRVYKHIRLSSLPGASAEGNILMGFKGTDFYKAGYVYAPYQMLYTTETITTADFMSQKGMASRYATRLINKDMYVRVNLLAGP
ncbi:MAG: hypothetical protein DRP42_04535 [Tenericutes bacterium]|nr:MAG: hypothetical protein DRP42_04535 [Mycoplasmatota bacterium]